MRRQPFCIGRITGKTATDLIINTSFNHFIKAY